MLQLIINKNSTPFKTKNMITIVSIDFMFNLMIKEKDS